MLLPHAFAAFSGRDLMLLDVRDDSYALILDAAAEPVSGGHPLSPTGRTITPECVQALVAAGLAREGSAADVPPLRAPTTFIRTGPSRPGRSTIRDVVDLAAALLGMRRRLARGLAFASFSRQRRTPIAVDHARLEAAMVALRAARLVTPTPRRCLPASLVAALFLARRGIATEIVFGVRTHPFVAHCWVEADGLLLDDEPDRVAPYHPICVAVP